MLQKTEELTLNIIFHKGEGVSKSHCLKANMSLKCHRVQQVEHQVPQSMLTLPQTCLGKEIKLLQAYFGQTVKVRSKSAWFAVINGPVWGPLLTLSTISQPASYLKPTFQWLMPLPVGWVTVYKCILCQVMWCPSLTFQVINGLFQFGHCPLCKLCTGFSLTNRETHSEFNIQAWNTVDLTIGSLESGSYLLQFVSQNFDLLLIFVFFFWVLLTEEK